jgi:hypothetical protein
MTLGSKFMVNIGYYYTEEASNIKIMDNDTHTDNFELTLKMVFGSHKGELEHLWLKTLLTKLEENTSSSNDSFE